MSACLTGTVFVIDDDDFILEVHSHVLRSAEHEVRSFSSAAAFLASYQPRRCECILTDLRMPDLGGLELYQALSAKAIDTPVIFITGHADVPSAVEAMRQGAFDYVEKPVHAGHLLARVSTALSLSAERYDQRQAQALKEQQLALLTPKEREIAQWVAHGYTSREIAACSALSVRTVENHRARVMDKLNAHSVVDLVRLLLRA